MSYYPALKQRLTCREVAPRYGLKVNASGMALCPSQPEAQPVLSLFRLRRAGRRYHICVPALWNSTGGSSTKAVRRFWDFGGRLPSRTTGCPDRNGNMGFLREGNSSQLLRFTD